MTIEITPDAIAKLRALAPTPGTIDAIRKAVAFYVDHWYETNAGDRATLNEQGPVANALAFLGLAASMIAPLVEERDRLRSDNPSEMRSDYIAAHLWLTQHAVPMLKDGRPATLTERVRMLVADRDDADAALDRMQPIRSLLADWEFTELDRHDLARDDRLADQVCDALKAVEAAEKKAAEEQRR